MLALPLGLPNANRLRFLTYLNRSRARHHISHSLEEDMKMPSPKQFMPGLVILLPLCSAASSQHTSHHECLIMERVNSMPTSVIKTIQTSENSFHIRRFAGQQQTNSPGAETYLLKEGTEVNLKFAQDLSSKTAAEDDRVNFELAEDLKVGEIIVAKAGAKAVGTVTRAKKSGMFGKGGELNVRLEYLKVGDVRVRLRGNKGKEGEDKTGTTVVLTVLFGPIGLIKHGKNVEVKSGTPLKTFVDEDIRLVADNQPAIDKKIVP